jgi:hypothetical protein
MVLAKRKIPESFSRVCDMFILTENHRPPFEEISDEKEVGVLPYTTQQKSTFQLKGDTHLVSLLRKSVEDAADNCDHDSGTGPALTSGLKGRLVFRIWLMSAHVFTLRQGSWRRGTLTAGDRRTTHQPGIVLQRRLISVEGPGA